MAIGLDKDTLIFDFPEVHPEASLRVTFQRTLRVPDDHRGYGLPPGLGAFPLRAIDDLPRRRLPLAWRRHGGIALPMWQSEACWISFDSPTGYPMAVKLAAGKVNAITGQPWANALDFAQPDYVEVPGQPWLDGFCVGKGVVRQFVAMPLGAGYTAEEQLTGAAEHGGMQFLVHPLRGDLWRERQAEAARFAVLEDRFEVCGSPPMPMSADMGLAPGGRIRQHIALPTEPAAAWDLSARSRCFVHIANSASWKAIAGAKPPTLPPSAADYTRAGLPWYDLYADGPAQEGSGPLAGLLSVASLSRRKRQAPLPENEGFEPPEPVRLRRRQEVRAGW